MAVHRVARVRLFRARIIALLSAMILLSGFFLVWQVAPSDADASVRHSCAYWHWHHRWCSGKHGWIPSIHTPKTPAPPPAPAPVPAPAPGGTILSASDEFNYTGAPNPSIWANSVSGCMSGNAGNGLRCPQNATVDGTQLVETGDANGNTGWIASTTNLTHGRWDVKMRVVGSGGGSPYHPVALLWPKSEKWPQGGEIDFFETDVGSSGTNAFIHHPTNSGVVQDHYSKTVDITQFHVYSVVWTATAITGYIDNVLWYSDTNGAAQPPGPMHLTLQLDNNNGSGMQPAKMYVDYVHVSAA